MYLHSRPGLALAPYIEALWYCEGYKATHCQERVLPNGRFQLIIDLASPRASSIVVGMRTRHSLLETASVQSVIGVVFRPGGARAFFDPPADEFCNCAVPLDQVWNAASGALRDRLHEAASPTTKLSVLEAELARRIRHRPGLHSAVRISLEDFGRNPRASSILEVARASGLSRRRFATLFREQVGLTPKLYCRLERFQQVVRQIATGAPIDWAQVSLEGGYYDQAHMVH